MSGFYSPRLMKLGILLMLLSFVASQREHYIVYMGELPSKLDTNGFSSVSAQHFHMLRQASDINSFQASNLVHSYQRSFNGFVAKVTKDEADRLAGMDGVVSVFRNEKKHLHTTRSWDFMGFSQTVTRTNIESDIIIGIIDSGVWPESASFNDQGFGPPPAKWKGSCHSYKNFTCNNKLIGAKSYDVSGESTEDEDSPRDVQGHGTHTASTVAGNSVVGANLFGIGSGTARGGVPSARIAVYKSCNLKGCSDADILAAFDDAIADGVDLISLSLGRDSLLDYFEDSIAIGAFHSMKNGILTSNSAGNAGPESASIMNYSPWSLSVAASTIDRKFIASVRLGNNATFQGVAINTYSTPSQPQPLIYAGDAPNKDAGYDGSISRFCDALDSLDPVLVKDKIVLCDGFDEGYAQLAAGASGTIIQSNRNLDVAFTYPLPASYLDLEDGAKIQLYINTTENPTATISKTTTITDTMAPVVVSFSSRGPNPITSDILKPDLTAPGVDILAAWSDVAPLTDALEDKRRSPYNIISGTSMSCPHATAAAAYVKSFNPTWSPSAIKSALMTTAFPMSSTSNEDAEFAYGSGHINPLKAINPGLIYDAGVNDYINFLCGQGYSKESLRLVTGQNVKCSSSKKSKVWNLNYPSFTLSTTNNTTVISRTFHRTVTNVGAVVSTYNVVVNAPSEMKITVKPSVLTFKALGQKATFVVSVEAKVSDSMMSGSIIWDDGVFKVRSPVVAYPI